MRDLIDKLVENLDWRIGPYGKGFRPTKKEMAQWQIPTIPESWTGFGWLCLMSALTYVVWDVVITRPAVGISVLVVAAILLGVFAGKTRELLQRHAKLNAYREKLELNERFLLLEYARYLARQIKRSQRDSSLGGELERERMQGVLDRLQQLLDSGAGEQAWSLIPSRLAEETRAAEALVETYEELVGPQIPRAADYAGGPMHRTPTLISA